MLLPAQGCELAVRMDMTPDNDYDDDFKRYVQRCAKSSPPRRPMPRDEFDRLSRRLDDLSLVRIERQLTSEEHYAMIDLSMRLCDDVLGSFLETGGSLVDECEGGWPRSCLPRREAWRQRRRRR